MNSIDALSGDFNDGNEQKPTWETPAAIQSLLPNVPVLDESLIPEPFRPWLMDVAHRMQTPPDFTAVSVIVTVGSIIGSGCGIRPKAHDGWEVIPNVWGACIGRPSVMLKSPSMNEVTRLLDKLQAKYGEQFEKEKIEAEFDDLQLAGELSKIKDDIKKAAKGKNTDLMEVSRANFKLLNEAKEISTRRLFKTNEVTIQSMTLLQNENERGILVFRDELTGLLVKWDREDGQDERAYFLEGWNGNGSYTDVKIGRGLTEAKNICISLLGGIQPDKLKRYLYQAMKGNNDGLMQRLQLAVWPDEPKDWQNIDIYPDKEAQQHAYHILESLADLDFKVNGALQSEQARHATSRNSGTPVA